ncbi:hypothetical protein F4860DRAFT_491986 [Xylaria cubensis]|nr:hypothetical protein F4860DRAFT_491986 [Xylaria cubensis]
MSTDCTLPVVGILIFVLRQYLPNVATQHTPAFFKLPSSTKAFHFTSLASHHKRIYAPYATVLQCANSRCWKTQRKQTRTLSSLYFFRPIAGLRMPPFDARYPDMHDGQTSYLNLHIYETKSFGGELFKRNVPRVSGAHPAIWNPRAPHLHRLPR